MIRRHLLAALLTLPPLLGAGGCTRPPQPPQAAAPPVTPKNVIVILADTLRADHLSLYGYARPTSPRLDAFASRGGVVFENARSQASCTFPSANSILTSHPPQAFLGQPEEAMGIPAAIPSLAEILNRRGFRTMAASASPIVRKSPSRFNPKGGFDRGFEEFHEECVWQPADCINRRAREALASPDPRPFFLYLHYIDPHGPYAPPPSHARQFATGTPAKDFIRDGNPNPIGDHLYKGKPDPGVTPAELQHLIDLYDDEIAYLDGQLEELWSILRQSRRLEDTIVVLVSDHGEEFLEHGHIKHCRTLFDTEIKVPFVASIPGVAPARIAAPVENLDMVPTVLDYLGLDVPGLKLAGRSLRSLLEKRETPEAPAAVQRGAQGPLRSLSDGRYKLVHDLASHRFQLFDLAADPRETRDVLAEKRRDFHRLRLALSGWLDQTEGSALSESVRRAEQEEQKLRSLGYIE